MPQTIKTVMVFGTFDILHKGHIEFFKQAREYGDNLIVVIGRDETVKRVKKKYPMNDEIARLGTVKQSGYADRVILGDLEDPYLRIKQIKPDVICLGYDQRVFADKLPEILKGHDLSRLKVVRLKAFEPEVYKTSKLLGRQTKNQKPKTKNKYTKMKNFYIFAYLFLIFYFLC